MGEISEFTFSTRQYLKVYPWKRIDPVPWVELNKNLSECRVAIISSAGFVPADQEPFDPFIIGGDVSFRKIPNSIDVNQLNDYHKSKSFDHSGMRQDPNVAFPIDRIREMAELGRIGSVNHQHLSFMGVITAPSRLINRTAPEAGELLVQDGVDVAILIPV